ncbi:MAG TPA: patatin-like phospholipase family protein [Puia sp.]|nr:patatin-like phospholipase family protein [Puia sp.]
MNDQPVPAQAGPRIPGSDHTAEQTDKRQLHPTPLKTPFAKIALALSGGGFRAASFSIGTMSYLHHLRYTDNKGEERNLLDNVEFISSASGGTFPGMLYAAYTKKGIPFGKVYKDMLTFMKGEGLLEAVLALMNEDSQWENDDKSRNFINAFAKIYDQHLFNGETFGVFWGEGIGMAAQPVAAAQKKADGQPRDIEVCFNATEFYRGLSFRWQTGGSLSAPSAGSSFVEGKTGNQYIYFDKNSKMNLDTLKQIKLGDIMASSSCFPAGFEPIIYPRDFSYPKRCDPKNNKGLSSNTLQQAMIITDYNNRPRALDTSIGLMDGGVDDNQGVYSAMLADKRRRIANAEKGFDLMIVSDVASYFMDPYVPPAPVEKGGLRKKSLADLLKSSGSIISKLNRFLTITGIVSVVLLAGAIGLLLFAEPGGWQNLGFFLLSPGIIGLLLFVGLIVAKKMGSPLIRKLTGLINGSDKQLVSSLKEGVPAVANFSDKALGSMVKYLKGARFGVLEQMGNARVGSMLSLLLDINLKQTRRLIFDTFFGNFYGKDVWGNRRVFNVIYELSLFNISSRESTIRNKFESDDYSLPVPPPADSWSKNCEDLLLKNCAQLNSVAEAARTMGTTLWYDQDDADSDRMDKVVACGQFTTCAKMLEYSLVLERILQQEESRPFGERTLQFGDFDRQLFFLIRKQLEQDWKAFKEDPFFMIK